MQITEAVARRFIEKVQIGRAEECWPWLAHTNPDGYGQLGINHVMLHAHRIAWEFWRGEIPAGLCVLHRCDNPPCCNPRHLWLGTRAENNADRDAKGRRGVSRGELNGNAKLTDEQAREIFLRYHAGGILQRDLAAEYGVVQSKISAIARGVAWGCATSAKGGRLATN